MPMNNFDIETVIISTYIHFTVHLVLQDTSLYQNYSEKQCFQVGSTDILMLYKGKAIMRKNFDVITRTHLG